MISYVGGASGLTGVLTAFGVATGVANPVVGLTVMLPVLAGAVAVALAVYCRRAVCFPAPPPAQTAVRYAEFFHSTGQSKAAFIPQIDLTVTAMRPALYKKAKWLNKAHIAAIVAIVLLLAPTITAVWIKFADDASKPKTPPTIAHVQ